MKLQYMINGEVASEYNSFEYIPSDNRFVIRGDEEEFLEYNPILKLDTEYDPSCFHIIFLNNCETTENSIYTVEVKNNGSWNRIGWVFPVQALLSEEHSQASNNYFLKYAYVATYLLLEMINKSINKEGSVEFYLDDIYDSEKSILVIDSSNTSHISGFCFDKYIIGLYKYGYSLRGEVGYPNSLPISTDNSPGKIKLKGMSDDIVSAGFINRIFNNHLTNKDSLVMRFHFCYQIIEILIQEIFNDQFTIFLGELSKDPETLFDAKDDINKIAGEKQRVRMLFEDYSIVIDGSIRNELNNACKKLLSHLQRKVVDNVAYNLYAVRCLIVHKLYTLSMVDEEETIVIETYLSDINNALMDVLINILSTFHRS